MAECRQSYWGGRPWWRDLGGTVCVCVCERERERELVSERVRECGTSKQWLSG